MRARPGLRILTAALLTAIAPAVAQEKAPIVVELLTSQGCSSCPPANEYFAELVRRPDTVALSFHVDYWNYLGWVDPFSSKKATYRQKTYAMTLRQVGVFMPKIVIQGRRGEVGSDRRAVDAAIRDMQKTKPFVSVALEKLAANRVRAAIGAATEAKGAEIWIYLFDRRQSTKIDRGENQGRTLVHHNVVRDWRKIGDHGGEKMELTAATVDEKGQKRNGVAVVVQQAKVGPIWGAAILYLED